MKQTSFFDEIIVDNFAGGGGASCGIELAIGHAVDIAINHDSAAIAMHKANHPETEHYCESVWDIDPIKVCRGHKVGLGWFSPDCKHFSKAKGKKPRDKNIRGLAWVEVKWAIAVRPRVMILENVEEFKTWGPLDKDNNPIEDRKGETFKAFIDCLTTGLKDVNHPAWDEIEISLGKYYSKEKLIEGLGYTVEYKELRACDFGAPTIRKRFFLIARCDGKPIIWPKPTHADPKSAKVKAGVLKPWRTAAEIIDWSIPCPSIFDRKKPLADNTLKRIAKGIEKFVVDNPDPFIVRIGQTGFGGDNLQYKIDSPLTTITTKAEHLLVTPVIARQFGNSVGHKVNNPLGTITAGGGGKSQLVAAFLSKYYTQLNDNDSRCHAPDMPIHTITTANRHALVTSKLMEIGGNESKRNNHRNEVKAFLLKYYGSDVGQSCSDSLHTITTKDRFGLVTIHGQDYEIVDIGMRMLEPKELFLAQGFPQSYIINRDYKGNFYPKAAQVARCGNSVPPPLAEHIVRANLPELCSETNRYSKVV